MRCERIIEIAYEWDGIWDGELIKLGGAAADLQSLVLTVKFDMHILYTRVLEMFVVRQIQMLGMTCFLIIKIT